MEGATVTDCLAIISYEMPEAGAAFEQSGVKLHSLTTFEFVLQVAKSRGILDEVGAASVRDWLDDPHGWAERHGFE
jgi:orotate phosphoribosyltransferase